ncbi:hypothetical protein ACHAWT_000438 [Skeletonema menzelii]
MENVKALGGKSSNNQRATRPGVVQITHNNNDGSASNAATIAASSAGGDCTPPLPELVAPGPADALEEIGGIPPQITLSSRMQQRDISQPQDPDRAGGEGDPGSSDRTPGRTGPGPQQEEVDAVILSDAAAAADTSFESPPMANNDGASEGNAVFSQDPQQQALPQEQQVGLLSEELLFDAEVELIGSGQDNDGEHAVQTTEEQPVPSVQLLTQSSFPVAQVVDASFEENDEEEDEEEEEEERGEHIVTGEEGDETANIDYSHVVLIRQEVALATTGGRDQDEQNLESSSREEGDNKCKPNPQRRSKRFVCGVVGVLAVVACILGAVAAVNNASHPKKGTEGAITDDLKNDLNIDDDMNVVEVLLKAFLEAIGTNDHRIPGTPQYKAIQWLYESAREGSERFNLSEWAIRQLLVQRYVMAVFYYTTGGTGTAGDSSGGWDDDCGFVTAKNECEWKCTKNSDAIGITCDESSRIQKILLPNNNLSGPIPIEFKALASLVELDISNNFIQGQLLESIGDLRSMKSFNAAHNELTGNLPSSLGNLSFLGSLNLMDNNLIGEIPPEVNRLGSLSNLRLSGNGFTGGMNNFCDIENLENRSLLRHQHRRYLISTFYADCSIIACDCCTHCCESGMPASSCQPKNP